MALAPAFHALGRVFVSACIGSAPEVREALLAARQAGVRAADVDEALLLVVAYAGIPRAILAFTAWRELEPAPAPSEPVRDRRQAGERAFLGVYGPRTARIRDEVRALHPELHEAVIEDSYGRILARRGLSERDRELLSVAMLVGLDGATRQAAAHALGAKSAGASEDEILEAAGFAEPWIGEAALALARGRLREILRRA